MTNKILNMKRCILSTFYFLLLTSCFLFFSCGYQITGSKSLPFNSVTIKPVHNLTYEPKLEEKLHAALSKEFIMQGIKVQSAGGDIVMESTIKSFELGSIATIDHDVYEQQVFMNVDIKLIDGTKTVDFSSMESPMRITFQAAGPISSSIAAKEKASEKACSEMAKEIISRIIIRYAK